MARSALLRSWSFRVIIGFGGLPQLLAGDEGWEKSTDSEGRAVQSMKIEAPAMTEEDQYGYNMPDRYKCDSCRAVMFHIDEELRRKQPKSRRLKSWEYTDLFEETCKTSFEGYGIKLVNGENVLSGPGLKDEVQELKPGMGAIQMGGDSWKKRLAEICRKIIFEKVGEEETYEYLYGKYKADQAADPKDFCLKEASYCTSGPKTPPKPKESKDSDKEKKAKEKKEKEKKEKAKKQKAEKAESAKKQKNTISGDPAGVAPKIDVQAFFKNLAHKHGLPSEEYLKSRTHGEWEKLLVKAAGKIFNTQSDEL